MTRFRAEWEPQYAVVLAWPHKGTDWADMLETIQHCYIDIARAIMADERLIVVTPEPDTVLRQLSGAPEHRLTVVDVPTNDTWTRDYCPLAVDTDDRQPHLLDFTFNAWGMKFAADLDNLVSERLHRTGALPFVLENHRDMVLEGGSVETDGNGTVMTTSACLLSPNRNAAWDRQRVEREMRLRLGAQQVLWVDHGYVPGDDTDSHIDTLARFVEGGVIVCGSAADDAEERDEMLRMADQLRSFSDIDGHPYRVVTLPAPRHIVDSTGKRIPATYTNFLITNHSVLVPTYGCPEQDAEALRILQELMPGRRALGIDCRPLIEQHGSLHCATMQLPSLPIESETTYK